MRTVFLMATLLCHWTLSGFGYADTESPKAVLGPHAQSLKVGPGMDARGLNLDGTELVGQDLRGARFDDAILRGCRISDCVLGGASFRGADLRGATITECPVEGCDFTDALINRISGDPMGPAISLLPTQLRTTSSFKRRDLSECIVDVVRQESRFDFREFDLRGTLFKGDFSLSRFSGARMKRARLQGRFPFDDIRKTAEFRQGWATGEFRCRGLDLSGIFVKDSQIIIRDAASASLANARFVRCEFRFFGSSAPTVLVTTKSYKQGTLATNSFIRTDLSNMSFDRMNLTRCRFENCNLANTTFNDAVISGADFTSATGLTPDQIKSTWNCKLGRMEDVRLPDDIAKALQAEAEEKEKALEAESP